EYPMGYLLFQGDSLKRLTQSELFYKQSLSQRDIFRSVERTTIADNAFGISAFWGMDNRMQLPPFFPVGRGQDVFFCKLVWEYFSHSVFAHLPMSLQHSPAQK